VPASYGCVIACRSRSENRQSSVWSRTPVLHGAEIVADVQLAGRLDAAENAFRSHGGHGPQGA